MPIPVKTGFTAPPMPGMPAPMQPMMPMGGPGTFPVSPLPAGQTPVPPSMPPMPLAGFPPPPVKSPMAQQGSNAPRRRRFGDSLEGMLGRNIFATQQQRPLPMPQQQQRMVAPGMPMMRTPTPRPMRMGGAVPRQAMIAGQPHGLAYINQDEEALLRSFGGSGIAGPGGIPSYPPSEYSAGMGSGYTTGTGSSNFDSGYSSNYKSAAKRRREKAAAAEKAAAIQQIKDAEAAALAAQQTPSDKMDFGDDEDYTPTSAALNQQLANQGLTNITTNFSPVDYTKTGSDKDFTTAAQADTDVSGAEFVAAGGLGSVDSGSPTSPPPVTLGSTETLPAPVLDPPVVVYTDMLGNTHSSEADRDRANLGIQQQMYGSGNQAAKNIQQQLYKEYAEQFPEGKQMEGDSEKLGQMAADVYLKYTPEINELLGPQGLPNQPFNLPFSFGGIEGITPRGSDTAPDAPDRDTTSVEPKPQTLRLGDKPLIKQTIGLPSEQDIGLGFGSSDYPDMSMTAIPGATTPMGYFPEDPGTGFPSSGTTAAGKDPNQFPVEEIQSMFGKGGSDKSKATPTEMITSYTDKDGNTTVDNPKTPQNEAMLAQLGLTESLASGRDIQTPNAAEAAYLQEALGNMNDPNFAEQVINKIIRNLTLGMFDPDDPQKRADAQAILKAYQDTGKFVYDSEENAIDLSTQEGLKQLEALTKGAGIEPAVTGVRDKEGNVVDFDDGTGFRNIMGDYNPVFSEDGQVFSGGSDTQNILTGSTDVFGGDNTSTITTGGDDGGDSGSDTGTDTGVDTGHTVDEDGNIVCNTEGYVYNPETKICEPKKEEEEVDGTPGSGIGTGTSGESFEDVLKRVVVAAPDVAPISANVRPMQEGGMAGLNRAADNFLKALAG